MKMGLWRLRGTCARRTGEFGLKRRSWRRHAALAALLLLQPGTMAAARPVRPANLTQPAPVARPALWVVSDHDTIIYLFGTFHAHDGKARWFSEAVKTAFDGSDQLVLETLVPHRPKAAQGAVSRQPGANGEPSAQQGGGLAGARVAMSAARAAGMSVQHGADAVLAREASVTGKPVAGLESFQFQLAMYGRLPGPAAGAKGTVAASNPAVAAFLRELLAAWNRGDSATFEAVVRGLHAQSPETYRILFEQRNAAWAGWIAERMNRPGVIFMAVGTGHLVGRDSVQAKLAARGIRSARVN